MARQQLETQPVFSAFPLPPPLPVPQSLLGPQAEMSIFVREAEALSLP